MPISNDNTRTLITISKELKAKLEEIAKKEKRSFNNLVVAILEDDVSERNPLKIKEVQNG